MNKLLPLFISAALGSLSTSAWADTLTDIYNQAKISDPTLLQAAAERDVAFEAIDEKRSTLLPQINLTAGYNLTRGDSDSDVLAAGVNFSQQLFNRTSWISLDTAEMTARQSDAVYAASQQALILRVSQAYFAVLRAQDNLVFIQAEKAAVGRQLEQTKQRFEVGLSAITDVHDAQAQYDSVLADEVLAQNDLVNSYEGIREITGQEHANLDILDTQSFSASKTATGINILVQEAGQKNLNLLAARISQDIAKENISLASSGHLPSLSLDGGYNYKDISNTDVNQFGLNSNGDEGNFNVGLNLAVPLYTGGNITSQTKQAEFAYIATSQNLEATYRGVVKDVRAFNNNISASIGALRAYDQTVISAKSALEATEAGFDVGTRTIVDVLDSTRRLYDANKSLSNARYDYILNVLKLRQAVGTLNEQDILDVNAGLEPAK